MIYIIYKYVFRNIKLNKLRPSKSVYILCNLLTFLNRLDINNLFAIINLSETFMNFKNLSKKPTCI